MILDVAPTISALTGTTIPISETLTVPVYAKRSAQTRVGIRNGQTVVIGGLMQDQLTETVNKVPILGDIPLLGEAFKHTDKKKSKTELLIFLTPHVAVDPDNLQGMSQEEMKGSKLVPGAVHIFRVTGGQHGLAGQGIDLHAFESRFEPRAQVFDGRADGVEAAFYLGGRICFTGPQHVDQALDVRAVIFVLHAEIEVNDMPGLDFDVRWPGMSHR